MTTPDVILVVGVLTTSGVTLINAWFSRATARALLDHTALAATADVKLDQIHVLTNNKMTTALHKITELEELVVGLRAALAESLDDETQRKRRPPRPS